MDCKQDKQSSRRIIINPNDVNAIQLLNDLSSIKQVNLSDQKEYTNFKEKLKVFNNVKTVAEAKSIAKTFLPIHNEINYITIGSAKCTIISRKNVFRIVLKGHKEIICYNFRIEDNENV